MRDLKPPFKFDMKALLAAASRKFRTQMGSVSLNLPFISLSLEPNNLERRVAREIVIRMADRRVLNAFECCDNCIDSALASLQEIRRILVDKQVEIADMPDSLLYLLIEMQVESIRQFLTFEQKLKEPLLSDRLELVGQRDSGRTPSSREQYFAALEMLRAHLHRCLLQVSKIAAISIPKIADHMRYDEAWQLNAYEDPGLISEP